MKYDYPSPKTTFEKTYKTPDNIFNKTLNAGNLYNHNINAEIVREQLARKNKNTDQFSDNFRYTLNN